MRERGLSPIVATVILIGLTVTAAVPLAVFFSTMYSPARPRRTDLEVYAGLVNENIVRFHILHTGGQTIYDPLSTEPGKGMWGKAIGAGGVENTMYCWTFENPDKFRQGDYGYCEVQLHGIGLKLGDTVEVYISALGRVLLYHGTVSMQDVDKLPG